jgi:molybdopterin-containing oxidoreductase family iron-sulfur binding subunit
MVIDLDRCTGCAACEVACKSENNIPTVVPEQAEMGRAMSWMKVMAEVEGDFPDTTMRFYPRPCMHCDNPPCIRVCPVVATYINDEGIVGQVYPRCSTRAASAVGIAPMPARTRSSTSTGTGRNGATPNAGI